MDQEPPPANPISASATAMDSFTAISGNMSTIEAPALDSSYANRSLADFYQDLWEHDPPTLALPWLDQIVLITLYTTTTVASLLGNVLMICVQLLGRRSRTELTIFMVHLAIADLCTASFCMPFTFTQTMLGRWIFGQAMCPIVLFMQVTSVGVSIYINVAIGLDRYWVVIYPLKKRLTRSNARVVVALIWVGAMILASPQLIVSRSSEQDYFGKTYMDCNEKWASNNERQIYAATVTSATYFIPLMILAVAYYKIAIRLWDHRTPGNADCTRDRLLLKSKRKVVKMVATLVVVFAICWFPLQTFNLVLDFAPHLLDNIRSPTDEQIYAAIFYICHWMAMANSFTNPVIFSVMNDSFRADVRSMLWWLPCLSARRNHRNNRQRSAVSRTSSMHLTRISFNSKREVQASRRWCPEVCQSEGDDQFPGNDDVARRNSDEV